MNIAKYSIMAVTFDLWETLLFERSGADSQRTLARCRQLQKALEKFGVETPFEQLLSTLKTMPPLVSLWEKDKDISHVDQLRLFVKTASNVEMKDAWIEELSQAYVLPLFEIPPYLNPDARRVLQWLKETGKHIGLICNTGKTPGFALRRFLEKEDVAQYFNLMLFSEEVGIRKPAPAIFQLAVNKFHVKPDEVVHVGDNLRSDVWGAQNAGMRAIYLSTEIGRDMIAESDPTSFVSLSRRLGDLKEEEIIPDKTITSLDEIVDIIESFDN